MKIDNLIKLNQILDESMRFAKDLSLSTDKALYRKIMQLLVTLVKIQALTTSIRADCIEELLSMNPNFPDDIRLGENSSHGKIIDFDRRRLRTERRKLQTYLAKDRRCGIADRRKRIQRIGTGENHLPFSTTFPKRKSWIPTAIRSR